MGYLCDFCGDQRSLVYCRSDAACLCLSCDRNVHSANALSRRHSRSLLCERCNSQPAFVRCVEDKISLCQNCDWLAHGSSPTSSTHKRQTINCYSGCPSAAEFSSIWSFFLDIPSMGEACEQELGLMSINENGNKSDLVPPEGTNVSGSSQVTDLPTKGKFWAGTSSIPVSDSEPRILDQLPEPGNECMPKLNCPGKKISGICEDDNLYDDFIMDEVDLELENYQELFGMALSHSEELFENGGIESLFETKDMSASVGESHCHGAVAAEGSSTGLVNAIQPACSNAASVDSMLSTKTEPIVCFTGRQSQSNISFSGVTKDSAGDYQECDASSMLLMGEPPWCPPCPESSLHSANRSNAVMRYKEKKKTRKFEKKVRYASRKARADVRRRVKGRFVKAGDVYDYDPLSQTRSY
ncbi:Zinc finger protein [Vigna angularis]|uniref:Zinc finger protein n=2 Tax=Phaseolus angularis TaxID=3914 RepID=A0A8T0K7E9_PHAAN|nr:zinc finger protein CONSTANS-LIKE 9 isoform X1 [Vigna angularis]XP_052736893.1 zinc finger protein CONSTANS-LIKE 9 isoform X1 [Vigna angularis]XP_052736894.1 zinc finger protein CONSTANS-LIKE 9 isoform X1 [Vigna angularis]XP_052736895.1 zinc finger protein CONSTANS-LIKE 9 isoform X1 [Vigna angularis]XP_052736896.1 zinc finger protein CONSTANS-LIKE 9 isoform X1 [Vigna angularis]XP_052736897.1 zinc finger protein CONSTANS-LIKE 9 isoform X1 [Vigna angularis]XP_052736898.1 zinc finger protein 